ncbi:protein obstructor-E-like [Toxorhynchites rutilus septentrionalis]|uniref:protein obstructor-E-like n=1 Tax=Toxorhynchites rutilus septentrionalis TaxID=329112 RepID=UPI002479DE0C|nr:protein obstructor-E-like [Toxorhynchites rutilus septentrionalis]
MHKQYLLFTVFTVGAFAVPDGYYQFNCPKEHGQFEDPYQCDKYYECNNGRATEKLCPDGLVFDPESKRVSKCDQPFNVDCGDRKELQPPNQVGVCLRQNGFFPHPDPSMCHIFYNCVNGQELEITCSAGLHFDWETGICVWPETAGRTGCKGNPNRKLNDGFQCPAEYKNVDGNGQIIPHPNFPHPSDCAKFYICLNGVEPRLGACFGGLVYNPETQRCDEPENVPGCEHWQNQSVESEK